MTRIRMVVADLDGTLRVERQPPTQRMCDTIARVQERGVRFVLATGRTWLTAQPLVEQLGLRDAAICDNGATVRDLTSGEILRARRVDPAYVRELLDYARERGVNLIVSIENKFYTPSITPLAEFFVGPFREHLFVPDHWEPLLALGVQKLTFVNEADVSTRILGELRARFGTRLQVSQSAVRYVEITHLEASKGLSAAWLADRWGIPPEKVMALGDQDNDRSMIEWAGLGIAMGNGHASLQEVAYHVTATAELDGASLALDRFILADANAPYQTHVRKMGLAAADEALARLDAGEVIAFPTDTVYGVGADGLNVEAIDKLYVVKDRPANKAIPLLLADAAQAQELAASWPESARQLAAQFWPGGLTLVVPVRPIVPAVLRGPAGTIGLRVPDHAWLRDLIRRMGRPLAATSANRSGQREGLSAEQVIEQLDGRLPLVIDGGELAEGSLPSTVVDVTAIPVRLLREGAVSRSELEQVLGAPVA